jgi:Protein of unknown function (DUF1592)/Protein of unknown function (DUF1588)/Protein of unknown function (DUF1585)/Protein of unknown function (DUF1587)/Protein of unknown function (DUF1595)
VKSLLASSVVLILSTTFVRSSDASPAPAVPPARTAATDAESNAVVQDVCVLCHNETTLLGNLSLEDFDVTAADEHADVAEKMIRKLRAGMMPPPGIPRPDDATMQALVETLEAVVDAAATRDPNPGIRSFQRLNRAEYERAIADLLSLEVDAGSWLPLDQMSSNFDNIADAQTLSPTLLEAYLNAAGDISRMAIGDRSAPSLDKTYINPIYLSQHPWNHVEGTPYGTRGGMAVEHVFPADAEYVFEMTFGGGENTSLEDIDVSIDGERVALLHYTQTEGGADGRGGDPIGTEPIVVGAGQHQVAAAFIKRTDGPYEDLIRPHDWSFAGGGSGGLGITTLPHLQSLVVRGPLNTTGLSDTPSRKRVFTCRPTTPEEERPCAESILGRLASEAYRRPVTPGDLEGLMEFYDTGVAKGGFEIGVRTALEAILASPYFVLRLEREPKHVQPGQEFRVTDIDLASRLSFFLWGTPPDEELLKLATEGTLGKPGELERQTKRMLADPRAETLATRFGAQWLRLQDLFKVHPDPNFYPNFDENLANAMRRETELFFYDLVKEDRSVLRLFDADYTFVNELLARHYGIPGVAGREFRRVKYPDDTRRGILGQGSVLVLTSLANRTSPVLRGKWVMEVLMGTPPPPPPPGVPPLDQTAGVQNGRMLTTRERMELHRASPTCNSCHRFMDPIGLSLDNFDVTAKWRVRENGEPLDTNGEFYDGTAISSEAELVDALLKRPEPLVRTFTENLMAYALGRRVEYYDQPTIRAITRAAEDNGYRISSFILGVVGSDAFQMKREEPVATDDAAAPGSNE